jgi:hypothetical protein
MKKIAEKIIYCDLAAENSFKVVELLLKKTARQKSVRLYIEGSFLELGTGVYQHVG